MKAATDLIWYERSHIIFLSVLVVSCSPNSIFSPLITAYVCAFFVFVSRQEKLVAMRQFSEGGKSTRLKVFRRASGELEVICVTFVTQRDDLRGVKYKVLEAFLHW